MSIASSLAGGGGSGSGGGGLGGSTGATDNTVLRADGVGGSTVQGSTVTLSDSGAFLGHVSALNADTGGVTLTSALSGRDNGVTNTDPVELPASPGLGETHSFYQSAASAVTVQAQGSHVIYCGTSASSAGGIATSGGIGSYLSLRYLAANKWIAVSMQGTWTPA